MNKHFDLIAVGGGSGGLAVAETAARMGMNVAVVEAHKAGGTCVNNGCVPKKVMWLAASLAHAVDDASAFGIPSHRGRTDWSALVAGRQAYIGNINDYWDGYVDDLNIHWIQGHARFRDAHSIEVDGQHYSADHIVLATGGMPIVPGIPGAGLGITSDVFFDLAQQPRKVAIIGGGYIGVELAGVLQALGSQVSLIALEDRVLEQFDPMISRVLMREMEKQSIDLHMSFEVNELSQDAQGISVHGSGGQHLSGYDSVIWAVGRSPNTRNLNLEAAGVAVHPNGTVSTDDLQNTNVPGIYPASLTDPLIPVFLGAGTWPR